jgi:hypothetical protein
MKGHCDYSSNLYRRLAYAGRYRLTMTHQGSTGLGRDITVVPVPGNPFTGVGRLTYGG